MPRRLAWGGRIAARRVRLLVIILGIGLLLYLIPSTRPYLSHGDSTDTKFIPDPYDQLTSTSEHPSPSSSLNTTNSTSPSSRILDPSLTPLLKTALTHRTFTAMGFQTCKMLNNARFDSFVNIKPLGGSVVEVNPTMEEFVDLIDERAEAVVDWLKAAVNPEDAHRYACYIAAEGTAHYLNMTERPLMHQLHPPTYFRDLIPAIEPQQSRIPGPRRKYKIAYLFLVHEVLGFPQLEMLINILDDGQALLLIHVDARSDSLHAQLTHFITKREKSSRLPLGSGNVFLAKKRFPCIWGHSSLVLAQLSGFWELRDLAEWEYVVNLSNFDWPLVRNGKILEVLNGADEGKGAKNWIEFWVDTSEFVLFLHSFYRSDRLRLNQEVLPFPTRTPSRTRLPRASSNRRPLPREPS
ncbi:hypothetical protein HK097_007076 [Rhizophlyctis rosea]|uniref:protein xylosyltransferase n=1 Tax=Rhizophlyctis rosea TaxID=64517 RepID=A0AAD5SDI4_9FUNG|nr:hypothetical protein HK097_007076 [Rhizophlyctis rosea]